MFKAAIERINKIKWSEVGRNTSKEFSDYGCEFLRGLASFYDEKSLKALPPFASNIALILGCQEKISIEDFLNEESIDFLKDKPYKKNIVEFYLQLALMADKNPDVSKYLQIYEPLIKIFESGGNIKLNYHELDIYGVSHFPLNNWYKRFLESEPINSD